VTPQRNVAASMRARLTDRARANKENVQLILTRYAIERLPSTGSAARRTATDSF
jgi:hypothetical protein